LLQGKKKTEKKNRTTFICRKIKKKEKKRPSVKAFFSKKLVYGSQRGGNKALPAQRSQHAKGRKVKVPKKGGRATKKGTSPKNPGS